MVGQGLGPHHLIVSCFLRHVLSKIRFSATWSAVHAPELGTVATGKVNTSGPDGVRNFQHMAPESTRPFSWS